MSPATLQIMPNAYYKSAEDYTWALAEAVREEYKAIVDAGFILQIDDPALVDIYDWWFSMNDDIAGYRKWAAFQVEAVNHALQGIPEDRVRFHICWGSWHGPHRGDVELKDVVDLLLKVKAQAYSVEAGNVRHEHEWKVWQDTKLPDGKVTHPRRRQPRHQRDRASGAGRGPHRALCQGGRPRERHRRHRLRPRWSCPSADRLGQARRACRRRETCDKAIVGLMSRDQKHSLALLSGNPSRRVNPLSPRTRHPLPTTSRFAGGSAHLRIGPPAKLGAGNRARPSTPAVLLTTPENI